MVLKEALSENFALFGVTVNDDRTLEKCLDLCDTYNLDEESLVETWMAFSVSHCQGANPNVEYLCQMEKKELKKNDIISISSLSPSSSSSALSSPSVFAKRDKSQLRIAIHNSLSTSTNQFNNDNDNIIEIYCSKTPQTPKVKRLRSPEGEREISEVKIRAVESPFSPSSYSPKTATPSRLSSNTSNRGKILSKYGSAPESWKNSDENRVVKVLQSSSHRHLPSKSLYMYEKLINKAGALDLICEDLGTVMCKMGINVDNKETEQVGSGSRTQHRIQTYGRICCDSDGKLNTASVLLEGSKRHSAGSRVKLDLRRLSQYSIFPGQIVAVKGTNPTGKSLLVEDLFFESPMPPPPLPQVKRLEENLLDVVVAAGPFTTADNLKYEPLMDLIAYIEDNKPHVFIMIGPFVEFSHQDIQECNMSSTFDEFFEQFVANVMQRLKDTSTQIVLVPSSRDVHHVPVYPTPEFGLKQEYQNLHLMPDPCMIDIDGIVIGTTAVDTLMHLGGEEISFNAVKFDRLTRLATHVLAQNSFYPLSPPSEDLNLDTDLWEKHATMNSQPHILILPSNLRYFCKNIYDCLALNPGRLAKRSFARLRINYPLKSEENWKPVDNIAVQILNI